MLILHHQLLCLSDFAINHEMVHTVLRPVIVTKNVITHSLKYCVFQCFLLYSFLRHPFLGPQKHYGRFTLIFIDDCAVHPNFFINANALSLELAAQELLCFARFYNVL